MASSVSAPVVVPQATKRTHAEMSNSDAPKPPEPPVQSSLPPETPNNVTPVAEIKPVEAKPPAETNTTKQSDTHHVNATLNATGDTKDTTAVSEDHNTVKTPPKPSSDAANTTNEISPAPPTSKVETNSTVTDNTKLSPNGASAEKPSGVDVPAKPEVTRPAKPEATNKAADETPHVPTSNALAPSSQPAPVSNTAGVSGPIKSTPEPMETSVATANQDTAKPEMETAASQSKPVATNSDISTKPSSSSNSNSKPPLEDGEEPEKKAKLAASASTSKGAGKTPEQILEYMDKTFEQRRKIITKQMPTIPELKVLYPDLFMGKQLLIEFQRITKIDIDQKIQEFCVRYATAVIEMARNKKGAAPVLARWEQAKQENDTLRQYWDMVTALCLLPLHFGENFVEMVLEIGEDEEVVAQGKIVPTLVARGNIFRTDEFFLIAENTIVQEFEEFTIAFASLYSSYWVFNMVYPETIENTYNYIQRCIVRQREPGSIPTVCKNFTKALQKWNKGKENK